MMISETEPQKYNFISECQYFIYIQRFPTRKNIHIGHSHSHLAKGKFDFCALLLTFKPAHWLFLLLSELGRQNSAYARCSIYCNHMQTSPSILMWNNFGVTGCLHLKIHFNFMHRRWRDETLNQPRHGAENECLLNSWWSPLAVPLRLASFDARHAMELVPKQTTKRHSKSPKSLCQQRAGKMPICVPYSVPSMQIVSMPGVSKKFDSATKQHRKNVKNLRNPLENFSSVIIFIMNERQRKKQRNDDDDDDNENNDCSIRPCIAK